MRNAPHPSRLPRRRPPAHRRGIQLIELIAAVGVMGILMAFLSPLIGSSLRAQTDVEERQLAAIELRNLADAVRAGAKLDGLTFTESAEVLSDLSLTTDAQREAGEVPMERVTLTVEWTTSRGRHARPLQLVVWRSVANEVASASSGPGGGP